jgi:hypothetical protein
LKRELASSKVNSFTIKYWGPVVCIAGALGVFGHDFPTLRFLPALPLLLAAFFLVSLAVVEVSNGVVRYRRLLKWREILREDILRVRIIWPPFIGSIKLKQFVFPWGRLYFVLDKNTEPIPFRRGEFPLVRFLNKEEHHERGQNAFHVSGSRSAGLRLYLVAGVGILTSLLILYLVPGDLLQRGLSEPNSGMPAFPETLFRFTRYMQMLVVQVISLGIMVFLAIRRRDKAEAWLYAFLSGFAITLIVGRLLS